MATENKLIVELKTIMLPETHEKFEDKLRDFLEKEGIEGCITNEVTGNIVCTRPRMIKSRMKKK